MNVIDRAHRYLSKMPPAISGSGGHDATFRAAACLVHGFGLAEADALDALRRWNASHCSPPWSEAELRHKVTSALAKPSDKPTGHLLGGEGVAPGHHRPPLPSAPPPAPTWPARDAEAIRRILSVGEGVADLYHRSPDDPDGHDSEGLIDALFPGDPLLCVAADQRAPTTAPRETLRDRLGGLQFIVPSPMTGATGRTQEGKLSPRCLENTGPRKYLVIECDFTAEDTEGETAPTDLCAGVLLHLAGFAPLVMAVDSGGKSIHGWFICEGRRESTLRRFMRYAVTLGADRATWTRCQFVRMPEGLRKGGNRKRQALLFLNSALVNP